MWSIFIEMMQFKSKFPDIFLHVEFFFPCVSMVFNGIGCVFNEFGEHDIIHIT